MARLALVRSQISSIEKTFRSGQPGPRHRDLDRPERARQRARPAAMTLRGGRQAAIARVYD